MNRGAGKWDEIGLSSEVGFSANGQPRSGMGVDAADFDQDGWEDLFVANVDQEMFSLYKNRGNESFQDVAHANGIAQSTRLLSGWGLKFFDYDNDGRIDLLLANGHPDDMIENYSTQVTYKEPLLLFHNEGGKLKDVSASKRAGVQGAVLGARPRRRRLRQRRPPRRADQQQRRGPGAAAQPVPAVATTGWASPCRASPATATRSAPASAGRSAARSPVASGPAAAVTSPRTTRARSSASAPPHRSTGSRSPGPPRASRSIA